MNIDLDKYLENYGLTDKQIETIKEKIQSKLTTFRKIRPGRRKYTKEILEQIRLNNKKSVKLINGYYVMSEFHYNILRKGIVWFKRFIDKEKDAYLSSLSIDELVELM